MIIEKGGNDCNCGGKGCFETYCSMKKLKDKIKGELKIEEDIGGKELKEKLKQNLDNERIQKIIDEYIECFEIGLSNLINIFEPEKICIGGSFVYYEDILLDRLRKKVDNSNNIYNKFSTENIVLASLKNDSGMIGATIVK